MHKAWEKSSPWRALRIAKASREVPNPARKYHTPGRELLTPQAVDVPMVVQAYTPNDPVDHRYQVQSCTSRSAARYYTKDRGHLVQGSGTCDRTEITGPMDGRLCMNIRDGEAGGTIVGSGHGNEGYRFDVSVSFTSSLLPARRHLVMPVRRGDDALSKADFRVS